MAVLGEHLQVQHEFVDELLTQTSSMEEFQMWKDKMEREETCSYVKHRGAKSVKEGKRMYYVCHRSGHYHSKATELSRIYNRLTNKIGFVCPARMTVTQKVSGVSVDWHKNHYGHELGIYQTEECAESTFSSKAYS